MKRNAFLESIHFEFEVNPIVAILGPRQCGKTTLARHFLESLSTFPRENYFDLEDSRDLERLRDPMLILPRLSGIIVIDEIQKMPNLFPTLRVLIDNKQLDQKYLILGSASRDLIKQSSETLAGRIGYLELTPFNTLETGEIDTLWLRGGFPPSYLAKNDEISVRWRRNYVKTYLEGDIPNLGIQIPPDHLRRFWMMLSHYHGSIFNASEIGRALGFSSKTIQRYLDILTGTFMVHQLQPWFTNISKRQVKSTKVNLRDSGILHLFLGIHNRSDLLIHPKIGASWEGFALEEIIRFHQADPEECYFWATYQGTGIDLLIIKEGKKLGFEFKYSAAPKLTKSMQIAREQLDLDHLVVIYPGDLDYALREDIQVIGLKNYLGK